MKNIDQQMKSLTYTFIIGLLLSSVIVSAQDIHFSQFYNSPLVINPAMTGNHKNNYRLSLIHRNQWGGVIGNGFRTFGFAGEYNLANMSDGSSVAFGLSALKDVSPSGNFHTANILASAAYHLAWGEKLNNFISLGIQGGMLNRSVRQGLQFESDLLGGGSEDFRSFSVSSVDARVGAVWSSFWRRTKLKVGVALLHAGGIDELFISESSRLHNTILMHGEGSIRLRRKKNIFIEPSFLVMNQGANRQFTFGSAVRYVLDDEWSGTAGIHHRLFDAGIVTAGIQRRGLAVNLSYDFNVSSLFLASRGRGGLEISITYEGQTLSKNVQNPYKSPELLEGLVN